MKIGDLVIAGPSYGDLAAVGCAHHLEVEEDFGDTIRARCLDDSVKHTARKKHFVVAWTLEQRLEANNMNPVLGKARLVWSKVERLRRVKP